MLTPSKYTDQFRSIVINYSVEKVTSVAYLIDTCYIKERVCHAESHEKIFAGWM